MLKTVLLLLVVTSLASCTDSSETLSPQQKAFCAAVTTYRGKYIEIQDRENYIDKKKALSLLFDERTRELNKLIGNGTVSGWKGTVQRILPVDGKGAFLEVRLACNAALKPQDDLLIKVDTDVYESLRTVSEKSSIVFSGSFLVNQTLAGKYPYLMGIGETSFTEAGSMREPEFLFKFTQLAKQA